MITQREAFKPEEHFRSLKGQQYLDVKWRVVWFRDEHPDGYIRTELVEHDAVGGLAVCKAQVGYLLASGAEVFATGYGSETRKDFADYLEKAETKAIGRALAMLGYGTAQAMELDEGERVADSPAEQMRPPPRLAVVPAVTDPATMRAVVSAGLLADKEAGAKLPKGADEMTEAELSKTASWLARRANHLRLPWPPTLAEPAAAPAKSPKRQAREVEPDPVLWTQTAGDLLFTTATKPLAGEDADTARRLIEQGRKLLPGVVTVAAQSMAVDVLAGHLEALYEAARKRWPEELAQADMAQIGQKQEQAAAANDAVAF